MATEADENPGCMCAGDKIEENNLWSARTNVKYN